MNFLKKLYSYIYFHSWRLGLWSPPDRLLLKRQILPFFAQLNGCQNVLFVGWADYCKSYPGLFQGKNFISVDPDPSKASFAKDHQHWALAVQDLIPKLPADFQFDVIFLNGVLGYGTNRQDVAEVVLNSCAQLLKAGGWLMTGINPHNIGQIDYDNLRNLNLFKPVKCPALEVAVKEVYFPLFPGLSHVFRFYQKIAT